MNQDLDAFELNNTWEVTTRPPGCHVFGSKWVFKTKFLPDGFDDKHKTRLVILGCHQKYVTDISKTFAPVVKLTTVRTLLVVTVMEDWITCLMDVSNAFLHRDLSEVVYMKLPPGYTHLGCRITESSSSVSQSTIPVLVCKLKKSLYGLKQAPRNWFEKLSSTLYKMNYNQSKIDYSLFIHHTTSYLTLVQAYVYDLLIAGNCSLSIASSKKKILYKSFHMKDLRNLTYFLGLEIHKDASGIFMCQIMYTTNILKEYGLSSVKHVLLPLDSHVKLSADEGEPLSNPTVFQSLVGNLLQGLI